MKNLSAKVTRSLVGLLTIIMILFGTFLTEKLAIKVLGAGFQLWNISKLMDEYNATSVKTDKHTRLIQDLEKERQQFIHSEDVVVQWLATTNDFFQVWAMVFSFILQFAFVFCFSWLYCSLKNGIKLNRKKEIQMEQLKEGIKERRQHDAFEDKILNAVLEK